MPMRIRRILTAIGSLAPRPGWPARPGAGLPSPSYLWAPGLGDVDDTGDHTASLRAWSVPELMVVSLVKHQRSTGRRAEEALAIGDPFLVREGDRDASHLALGRVELSMGASAASLP